MNGITDGSICCAIDAAAAGRNPGFDSFRFQFSTSASNPAFGSAWGLQSIAAWDSDVRYSKRSHVKRQQMPILLTGSRTVKSINTQMLMTGNMPSQGERRSDALSSRAENPGIPALDDLRIRERLPSHFDWKVRANGRES
jgi:hypothetical protein